MWDLTVTNIGGIRHGSASVEDGLNVVQASNFRGKSSLIAALKTGLGATGHYDDHPLTEGTDRGEVTLETEQNDYSVALERPVHETVVRKGDPYVSDEGAQLAVRLFACLDADNPIRQAVRNGVDITELLQAPLDFEDLDSQIETLTREKREIDEQIAEAKRAGERVPTLQETVTRLESELDSLRDQRDELAEAEASKAHVEQLSDEISALSEQLANVTEDISRLEGSIERKDERVAEIETELADLTDPTEPVEATDIPPKRERLETLEERIALVEDLYRANQNVVDADALDVLTEVNRSIAASDVTCWVCGEETTNAEIEAAIDRLQSKLTELRDRKGDLESEIEELEAARREYRRVEETRDRLETEKRTLRTAIDEKRGLLQEKRARQSSLEDEIDDLETELASAEAEYNEELTDVKTQIRTTESKLSEKREALESHQSRYDDLDDLQRERDDVRSTLTDLRNRKKRTQETLKDRFNAIITDIIDAFGPGFSSARLVLKTDDRGDVAEIDLEIGREIDDAGQRTSVDTLSEGEVELIGLVVAIAGYHAFDVGSTVPCILIDGISQLAAEHLQGVASYLEDTSEILVTTAYPEAGDFDGSVITPDEWKVVSDKEKAIQ
ncbi:archaea-specific SMC-related protein [Halovivax cerinus]|uniref:Archaea-specific SMC-related protein n=1 Tax=Halovivax cerinus TaxID=1487865 RepID=A0ABD5NR04_9EURY|nr:archaea-specific SMC-related protein [Halovivax cerinus]